MERIYLSQFFVLVLLVCFVSGCGVNDTEKTSFSGVDAGTVTIEFKDVWLDRFYGDVKANVWVFPEKSINKIQIEVDSNLSGTVLSVIPTFVSKIFSPYRYTAKKVVVWVSDKKDKIIWEKWLEDSRRKYFLAKEQEKVPDSVKRIIP